MPQSVDDRSPFSSIDDVVSRFAAAGYITDRRLATTIYLVTRLNKPVLLEGPAGVGKTELAKTLATVTGRRLLRLQCYEGQDETRALYEWDYGKQLLYTQMLREKINDIIADAPDIPAAVARIEGHGGVFFSDHFLVARPLLDAIRGEQPAVLLIDEVDRADEALEAVFLECLGEFQVSVPEIGTYTAKTPPYVVLTSNNTQGPLGRAQAPLPAPVPRLPGCGTGTRDRAVQADRAARGRCPAACPGGARTAGAAAAQEPEHLRDDRLGPHADRARRRRARRGRARRHRQRRAEVRAGHAARRGGAAPPGRPEPGAARRGPFPWARRWARAWRGARTRAWSRRGSGARSRARRRQRARRGAQAVLAGTAWTARPTARTSERPWTSRAGTTRDITALRAPARPAAPRPARARAAGRSRRSLAAGPAEGSWAWKAACTDSCAC